MRKSTLNRMLELSNIKTLNEDKKINLSNFDACLLLVPHKKLLKFGPVKIRKILKKNGYFFDMNSSFASSYSDGSL